jgi:hypothetical protein
VGLTRVSCQVAFGIACDNREEQGSEEEEDVCEPVKKRGGSQSCEEAADGIRFTQESATVFVYDWCCRHFL